MRTQMGEKDREPAVSVPEVQRDELGRPGGKTQAREARQESQGLKVNEDLQAQILALQAETQELRCRWVALVQMLIDQKKFRKGMTEEEIMQELWLRSRDLKNEADYEAKVAAKLDEWEKKWRESPKQ